MTLNSCTEYIGHSRSSKSTPTSTADPPMILTSMDTINQRVLSREQRGEDLQFQADLNREELTSINERVNEQGDAIHNIQEEQARARMEVIEIQNSQDVRVSSPNEVALELTRRTLSNVMHRS